MALKTFIINSSSAQYTDEEMQKVLSEMLQEGIIGNKSTGMLGFEVSERGTPDMNVEVSAGEALVEVAISGRTFKVVVSSDATETVAIASNSSGSNRVDAIIVRVDKDTEPNSLKTNVATVERVAGTGTSPLSDSAIDTAVGNDGWYRLADVTVADSETAINNSEIDDKRVKVKNTRAIEFENADNPAFGSDDITQASTDQEQTGSSSIVPVGESDAASNNVKVGQSFKPTKSKMRGVKLFKKTDTGTFTGTVTVSLQADVSGNPSGTALATVTISNADWGELADDVEFEAVFDTEYAGITIGDTYWVVIETSTTDTSNHPNIGAAGGNPYANGGLYNQNTSDGWVEIVNSDAYFKSLEGNEDQIVKTKASGKVDRTLIEDKQVSAGIDSFSDIGNTGDTEDVDIVLGFRPKIIRFHGFLAAISGGFSASNGSWQDNTMHYIRSSLRSGDPANLTEGTGYVLRMHDSDNREHWRVTVINVTNNGFTIRAEQRDTSPAKMNLHWTAEE